MNMMRSLAKIEYLILPKGRKFKGSGKLGVNIGFSSCQWIIGALDH